MCLIYILGLFLILITALTIFILSCDKNASEPTQPIQTTIEKWSNMDDSCPNEDNSPLYAGCNGFNCPLDKRKTKRAFYDDGYKMEDDRYQCLCKCTRKCNPSTNSSKNNKEDKTKHHMGKRLPFHPWFAPNK
jgi:hypothetical protein